MPAFHPAATRGPILALALALTISASSACAEDGWTRLFNGRDLQGWTVKCRPKDRAKQGYWRVEDGAITARTPKGSRHDYIWLVADGEYADFELRMRVQTRPAYPGNSGVQVRSRYDAERGWMHGPQVDLNPPGPWRNGFIYDETRGVQVWLWPDVGRPANAKPKHAPEGWKWRHADGSQANGVAASAGDAGGEEGQGDEADVWNDVRIVCRGTRIQTFINGVPVADYDGAGRLDDEAHRRHNVGMRGKIALQIHPGGPLLIRFKDIELKRFDD